LRRASCLLTGLLLTAWVGCAPPAQAPRAEESPSPIRLAVLPDGELGEWEDLAPAWVDPSGDGAPGGLDLGALQLTDDGEALFLALDVQRATILQNGPDESAGSDLTLYLDRDADSATGLSVGEPGTEEMGADVEIRFGRKEVLLYGDGDEPERITPGAFGLQTLPTHSARRFEIRLPLSRTDRRALRLALRDGTGDRLPDTGFVAYTPSRTPLPPPEPIPLDRSPASIRLLSLNLNRRLDEEDSDPAAAEAVARLLRSTQPDVINLQELYQWSAEQARAWVSGVLPTRPTRRSAASTTEHAADAEDTTKARWYAAKSHDCVTVSRFPLTASAPVDNNLVVALDLPDSFTSKERATDLVLFNAHTPCCENNAGRDQEMDHLAATWRDLMEGRGPFPVAPDVAAVFLGDFNLVGFRRQLAALRDGALVDPADGPDFAPGRARGSLAVVPLRHSHARQAYTGRHDSSPFGPGRLDWVFYTADALEPVRSYLLDTTTMPHKALKRWGLEPTDTVRASDHRVVVVDFRLR
jgi:endonuclease/exonuclease/phosphatase family metal-dependent hydrolase